MSFAHLHVHTEYSLLDGSNKIKEYVARVKKLGMTSAAITDHGVMYGVIDFYREAVAAGINPVLGCEVYVAPGSRFDKTAGAAAEERYYHLVLLAENDRGYANLIKIVSKAFTEGYYYKPRVDMELLREYHEGIIALSACLAGEVPKAVLRLSYGEAVEVAKRYEDIFGKGNFFLELQDHGLPDQKTVNQALISISRAEDIPLVATNDVHYTMADDDTAHDILLCIQTGKKLTDTDRMKYEGGQYYLKSEDEMRSLFPYAEDAVENTQKIADRCHVNIEFGVTKLPMYEPLYKETSWEMLKRLCDEGLVKRYGERAATESELRERLNYELGVIRQMGYVDYFLIVWDFIKYAKDHGIMVGPGRGSAAGSIVSYCLGITSIDPIRYQLLFERFLNPERVSMPDIDVDFCFERRQEVIDYVVRKYGSDRVAQIVTFGTLQPRGVIRDVGRVMNLPYAFVDSIAKMIPKELDVTLDSALAANEDLRTRYGTDEQVRNLIDMARRLEGLPRHASMHAAGVVISQKAVDEYVPLALASDGSVVTQFTMTTLEELGLLKMDFLGLRTLTVIQNAAALAEKNTGEHIDLDHLNYDDKAVLGLIGSGKTEGIFQLEGAGMKSFMKELSPQSLEDIIAGIALYRPGPMDFIPQYIKGKNDPSSVTYDCPQLIPILSPTYGCIVYQEQVMQIVRDLAGYTLGRSDLVRRAMAKKKGAVMQKERHNFVYGNPEEGIPGCISNGIAEDVANKIYDEMLDFAKYAFNKSHAAAYAVVAYQTAYLKYYRPVEFMAALMTSVIDKPSKVAEYIYSCREMGINIIPPDVNAGEGEFTADGGDIRYGLAAIKSIGAPVIDALTAERQKGGPFKDLRDFIRRLTGREINKRTLENLIKAGAFDCFGATRKQLMLGYSQISDQVSFEKKTAMSGQMTLFDTTDDENEAALNIPLPDVGEYDRQTLLSFEKEVLGIYISGHPLTEYEGKWKKNITATTKDFKLDDETGRTAVRDGAKVTVGGMITAISVKYTSAGKTMAIITVEDLLGSMEVLVFSKAYEKYRDIIKEDAKVFVKGNVSEEDEGDSKLICEKIVPFEKVGSELWVRFASLQDFRENKEKLYEILRSHQGSDAVVVYLTSEKAVRRMPPDMNVNSGEELKRALGEAFGRDAVRVKDIKSVM